jgi:hypothetical protein
VPVYNVSMPLLARMWPDRPAFRVFEVPLAAREPAPIDEAHTPTLAAGSRGRRATDAVAS